MSYRIPEDLSTMAFRIVVTNHRMTEKNAKAMGLLESYPLAMEVFQAE